LVKRIKNHFEGGEETSRECPNCHSKRIWKDGIRETKLGFDQRFVCRDCWHRFSESSVLSTDSGYNPRRQVCELLTEGSKNLAVKEPQKNGLAGATMQTAEVKGKIVEFLWHLEKENRSKRTISSYATYLDMLLRIGADLFDTESVKENIARQESWKENTKRMAAAVYKGFAAFIGMQFISPRYRIVRKVPFIPSESQLGTLIVGSPKRLTTLLQLLKETAMRIGEALALK